MNIYTTYLKINNDGIVSICIVCHSFFWDKTIMLISMISTQLGFNWSWWTWDACSLFRLRNSYDATIHRNSWMDMIFLCRTCLKDVFLNFFHRNHCQCHVFLPLFAADFFSGPSTTNPGSCWISHLIHPGSQAIALGTLVKADCSEVLWIQIENNLSISIQRMAFDNLSDYLDRYKYGIWESIHIYPYLSISRIAFYPLKNISPGFFPSALHAVPGAEYGRVFDCTKR